MFYNLNDIVKLVLIDMHQFCHSNGYWLSFYFAVCNLIEGVHYQSAWTSVLTSLLVQLNFYQSQTCEHELILNPDICKYDAWALFLYDHKVTVTSFGEILSILITCLDLTSRSAHDLDVTNTGGF